MPRPARRIVALVRALGTEAVITTDHFKDSLYLNSGAPRTKLFWMMHGLYLDHDPTSLTKEEHHDPIESRITLFTMSSYDILHYRRWGVIPEEYVVVGSPNNSLYLRNTASTFGGAPLNQVKYDICLIEKGITLRPDKPYRDIYLQNWTRLLELLRDDLHQNRKSLVIALSSTDERSDVESWIRSILDVEFATTDSSDRFATYRASDQSVLTIGLASTALLEALNRGNKVLSLNFSKFPNWDFPGSGISRLGSEDDVDLTLFSGRVKMLIEMSHEQYFRQLPPDLKSMIQDDAPAIDKVEHRLRHYLNYELPSRMETDGSLTP